MCPSCSTPSRTGTSNTPTPMSPSRPTCRGTSSRPSLTTTSIGGTRPARAACGGPPHLRTSRRAQAPKPTAPRPPSRPRQPINQGPGTPTSTSSPPPSPPPALRPPASAVVPWPAALLVRARRRKARPLPSSAPTRVAARKGPRRTPDPRGTRAAAAQFLRLPLARQRRLPASPTLPEPPGASIQEPSPRPPAQPS